MTNLAPELTVVLPVMIFQFIIPIVLVCAAAYFGARKGAERALRDRRGDDESNV
jgi:hypothetical protein